MGFLDDLVRGAQEQADRMFAQPAQKKKTSVRPGPIPMAAPRGPQLQGPVQQAPAYVQRAPQRLNVVGGPAFQPVPQRPAPIDIASFAQSIAQFSRPIQQGGANAFADAGMGIEEGWKRLQKDITLANEMRGQGVRSGATLNTTNANQLISQYQDDLNKGLITREQYQQQADKIMARAQKNTTGVRQAEQKTGIKLAERDAIGGILSATDITIPASIALKGGKAVVDNSVQLHNSLTPAQRQGGFIAGPSAKGFKDAQAKGQVFDGVDGKQRFEGDDSGARIKNSNGKTAGEILDHPQLFDQYDDLRNVKVKTNAKETKYDPETDTISLESAPTGGEFKGKLLHEMTHAIQKREGFNTGTSPQRAAIERSQAIDARLQEMKGINFREMASAQRDKAQKAFSREYKELMLEKNNLRFEPEQHGFNNYRKNAGEAEARAVQARMNMGMGERYVSNPIVEKAGKYKSAEAFWNNLNMKDTLKRPLQPKNIGNVKLKDITSSWDMDSRTPNGSSKSNIATLFEKGTSKNKKLADFTSGKQIKKPILVEKNPEGGYRILDGNHRFLQAHANGENEILAVFKDNSGGVDFRDFHATAKGQSRSTFYDSLDVPKENLIIRSGGGKAMSIDDSRIYKPTKAIKKAEDDFANGKITANQLENIRQKVANTAKASTKKALPRAQSQEPSISKFQKSSKSGTTQVKLNTNRLDVTDEAKVRLDKETNEIIAKMSNEDVKAFAKAAGTDMKNYDAGRTRKKIAEQLNLRNEITTLERQIADAKSAGDTARVTDLMAKSAELGRTSRSQGTDIARQLQARRIIADTLATPQQKLFRLFDEAGVDPEVYTKRMATVDMNNADEVVKAYRDLVPAKFGDWLDKFRYTNMLSSPLTHMVNITSNLGGLSGIAPVEKVFAGAVDATRSALTGGPRTRFSGEAGAYVKGAAKAVPEAMQKFSDVMTGKKAIDMPDAEALKYGKLADGGVLGTADTVLSFIPKLLEASDQLGMTLARGGERRALNYRGARNVELPRDLDGAVDDAALYRVFRQELNKQGQGYLLGTIDAIPSAILALRRSKNPIVSTTAKFTIPFVTTPVNLFKQGIEYSPAGVLTLAGHADKTGQAAKALMGTTVVTLAASALAAEDRITFAEPSDAKQRDAFRAEGKQPYAIKIGDKWFGYSKTHPAIAFNLASVAAAKEAFDKSAIDQSGMDKALGMFGGVMGYYRDQSFMKGVGDFTSNLEMKDGGDAEAAILSMAGNWSKQLVPFNSMVSWIGRQVDPTQRKVDRQAEPLEQFRQNLVRDMPFLNKDVPARMNPYYKDQDVPIMNDNPTLNAFSPIRVTNDKGYGNTTGLNMTERREMYEMPDADKPAFRQAAIDKKYAAKVAKAEKEKTGTSTTSTGSDIKVNATLAKADKDVITKYDSLDEAKRKEWFNKENDAEYKVAKAKFENDKKEGKLDQVSEYKRSTELKKHEIGSKYSKETRDLYKLGKSQLYNYVTNSPKGEQLAKELLEYDQKLVEAGLNPYNNALKFKNGLAPAKGGKKSSGRVRTAKAKKGRATGKGSKGGKQAAPKMDSGNAGAIRLAALGQKKSTGGSFKKQLKVAGGIKKPSITAFKKAAKTNVNVRRKA